MDFLEQRRQDKADVKNRLEEVYNMKGHPKADTLFRLAWDFGHSEGYEEIVFYYAEMLELLK